MDKPLSQSVSILFAGTFWLWNGFFIVLFYGFFLPFWAPQLLAAMAAGEVAPVYLIPLGLLLLMPVLSVAVGLIQFGGRPRSLLRWFYGVEAPLMLVATLWLFLLRDVTPGAVWTLGTGAACLAAYGLELVGWRPGRRDRWGAIAGVATSVLMLGLAIGLGALMTLYAIPTTWSLLTLLAQGLWSYEPSFLAAIRDLIFTAFFALSVVLLAGMPVSVAVLYWRSGLRGLERSVQRWSQRRMFWGAIAVLGFWMVALVSLSWQPQHFAFRTLDRPITTDRDRQALIDQGDRLRRGLLNAYLQRQRYLATTDTSRDLADLYRFAFKVPDGTAEALQQVRDRLIFPFLYQGHPRDRQRAARLYEALFDQSIERGERESVQRAFRASASLDGAGAGALNVNERRVLLERQDLSVSPHGDWATVELHEVYRNQTLDPEEVLYSFSLPESAVVTGLWLGDTGDLAKRFSYRISPRGAAQKVYESQVQRVAPQDPALLEQVGPQQYRLRAFPVPPRLRSWETNPPERPTAMHLWLTLEVPRQGDRYPLPKLLERRNIYWTSRTERRYGELQTLTGPAVEVPERDYRADWLKNPWLPTAIAAQPPQDQAQDQAQGQRDQAIQDYGAIAGYQITAEPLPRDRIPLPTAPRLAVILDTSYSMVRQRPALKRLWQWFEGQGYLDQRLDNGDVDLFLPGDALSDRAVQWLPAAERFDLDRYGFFGTLPPQRALVQFQRHQAKNAPAVPYDAVLLVTDRGSYELAGDRQDPVPFQQPLWLLHLGGQLPEAYDDATLASFRSSGGGVATDIETLLAQVALRRSRPVTDPDSLDTANSELPFTWADGYRWRFTAIAAPPGTPPSDPQGNPKKDSLKTDRLAAAPAARQLILALAGRTANPSIETLDRIHRIATTFGIVTPYSSAIVLVNDEQRAALDRAEASRDRFNRTVVTGKEEETDPNVASVPESSPLYGLPIVLLLLWSTRSRSSHRRNSVSSRS
ncbi:MAG: hypothetical protein Fur0042_21280 [Cyanophyceae cyanobacterium]